MDLNPARMHAQLFSLTKALVDIPSVSNDEAAVTSFIREQLPDGLEMVFDNDVVLFATTPRRPGVPLVLLAGHTDTVPIENNVPSTVDGDILRGRGTSDMKSGLAVMIEIARSAVSTPPPDIDLGFVFFGREELTTEANVLLPAMDECESLRTADFAILMEPTANALEAGCLGGISLDVDFIGEATHSARPWTGRNAAHMAIEALHELAIAEPVDVVVDGLTFREVASVTTIAGGVARNVITPHVKAGINVRYAPSRVPAEVEAFWRARFGEGAEVTVVGHALPAPVVLQHDLAQRLLRAGAGAPVPKQAWTNAADFAAHGIPAVNFGPGEPRFAHRHDEQVTGAALLQSFTVLLAFIKGDS